MSKKLDISYEIELSHTKINKILMILKFVVGTEITSKNLSNFIKIINSLGYIYEKESDLLESPMFNMLTYNKFKGYEGESGFSLILNKMQDNNFVLPHSDLNTLYLYFSDKIAVAKKKEAENISGKFIEEAEHIEGDALARLIMSTRNLEIMNSINNSDAQSLEILDKYIEDNLKGRNINEINDAIQGIIIGQTSGSYLFLRELVQNSRDEIIKKKAEVKPRVDIETFVDDKNEEFVVSVRDYVGIESLRKIVQYLLKYDSSDKGIGLDQEELIGMFGKGFFTIFDGTDIVRIKTGINGIVYDIELEVKREDGKFNININKFKQYENVMDGEEKFRGTEIQRVVKTKDRLKIGFELLKIDIYLKKFCQGFDKEELQIFYEDKNKPINQIYEQIDAVPVFLENEKLGDVKVYLREDRDLNKENILTVGGSFLSTIDGGVEEEYLKYVPKVYRDFILKYGGLRIDLPKKVRLTSGRFGILEKYMEPVRQAIAVAVLKSMCDLYRQKGIRFPGLPEDILYDQSGKYVDTSLNILQDKGGIYMSDVIFGNYKDIPKLLEYQNVEDICLAFMMNLPSGEDNISILDITKGIKQAKIKGEDISKLTNQNKAIVSEIRKNYDFYDPEQKRFVYRKGRNITEEIMSTEKDKNVNLKVILDFAQEVFGVLKKQYYDVEFIYYLKSEDEMKNAAAFAGSD
ncbi:hypothetical protein KKC59_02965, partial [bacterium]|nr:hypothetical protein [bacterium]